MTQASSFSLLVQLQLMKLLCFALQIPVKHSFFGPLTIQGEYPEPIAWITLHANSSWKDVLYFFLTFCVGLSQTLNGEPELRLHRYIVQVLMTWRWLNPHWKKHITKPAILVWKLKPQGVLITHPSNPFGTKMTRDEMNLIIDFVNEKEIQALPLYVKFTPELYW